jgi:RNA-directed DNA polymerase
VGEGANKPEAQSHPDWTGVDAAGRWSEGHASYLGRSAVVLETARDAERRTDAAAEVSNGRSSRLQSANGPNIGRRTGAMRSSGEGDVEKKAEKPERTGEDSGGTAKATGFERQASTARGENAGSEDGTLFEEVLRRENVLAAYQRVVRNGGAPGVDGITVDELMAYCQKHWARIRKELLNETYQPQPVRKVDIPKPDGGMRTLGIPTVLDRMIQQALLQTLQPIFDPAFSDSSFGYRPGRSAQQAVVRAREHIAAGYRWVVDLDLEKFFDRVNHDVLMARLARRVKDKRVLRLIRRYLQAGLMEGGLVSPRAEGTPQGGPLSPLLSNILLDELDREIERRGHRFVRYADDSNVYVQSKAAGERVMASLEQFLWKKLRLRVNRSKSAVARPWERKFLGYSVTIHREPKLKVSPESIRRLKNKLRQEFRRARGRNVGRFAGELTPIIRGWVAYYRLADVRVSFEDLDQWLRRKFRATMWRQWKRPATRFRKLMQYGLDESRAAASAFNGFGPWWNAGASHMNQAVPTALLRRMGLVSFLDLHRRFQRSL